jgi:hypothetical protein
MMHRNRREETEYSKEENDYARCNGSHPLPAHRTTLFGRPQKADMALFFCGMEHVRPHYPNGDCAFVRLKERFDPIGLKSEPSEETDG